MTLPQFALMSAQRAWLLGFAGAVALSWISVRTPLGLLLAAVVFAIYALTVRPRAFAASGVLFGTLPLLTWGIVDGLMKCASFNRNGGFCKSDPSAQVAIAVAAYVVTVAVTVVALRRTTTRVRVAVQVILALAVLSYVSGRTVDDGVSSVSQDAQPEARRAIALAPILLDHPLEKGLVRSVTVDDVTPDSSCRDVAKGDVAVGSQGYRVDVRFRTFFGMALRAASVCGRFVDSRK